MGGLESGVTLRSENVLRGEPSQPLGKISVEVPPDFNTVAKSVIHSQAGSAVIITHNGLFLNPDRAAAAGDGAVLSYASYKLACRSA